MNSEINELISIQKVENNSELQNKLLEFVKNFSWEEVKEHVVTVIKDWKFQEWETPFVAIVNDNIVGMATIMKTDYYPLPEIFPWISTIFVSEEYRGHKLSEKLIEFANEYAYKLGFEKTYIPTEFVGLYEKYGYHYIKDIVNYGNGIDRLYAKDLEYLNALKHNI
ncbi:MAG: GNAT family N-acetyltransferase [Bacilli bacterium]|nr:GNAT family N-acetyltransferase [Bacilli bacterium]